LIDISGYSGNNPWAIGASQGEVIVFWVHVLNSKGLRVNTDFRLTTDIFS